MSGGAGWIQPETHDGPLRTTVVGSYPQPEWLIDRKALSEIPPPRVRQPSLWLVPPALLAQAQDDATLLAIRDMELAGVDTITDGEVRRESYSNRFANALQGVDADNPGVMVGRSGREMAVPRVVGPLRRVHPVQVEDLKFLRRNTERRVKATLPGPFTLSLQTQNDHYPDRESLAMAYAACVNEEAKDLAAAGADIVQLDEPWLQTNAEEARKYAVKALDAALEGVKATTAVHSCFGYAAMVKNKPSSYPFLAELEASSAQQISIEAEQPRLDLSVLKEFKTKTIVLGVLNLGTDAIESPSSIAARLREAMVYLPPERLMVAPDCGMKYLPREVAFQKLKAMVQGAAMSRN
jgi:5-methyltetrahydropteroyltriglutamate--homocysteine methyltransferase